MSIVNKSDLNLEEFRKAAEKFLGLGPFLQVIAVYDCDATKDQVIQLNHSATLGEVVKVFGMEAGPVVRWFWKPSIPMKLFDPFEMEVAPINQHGFALVMSDASLEKYLELTADSDESLRDWTFLGPRIDRLS